MKLNIYTGKRVLYKHEGQWCTGILSSQSPKITSKGLYLFIVPKEFMELRDKNTPFVHDAEINDIFFEAELIREEWKQYSDIYMTKEEYCDFIEQEDFNSKLENAWVADEDYYYYHINAFNRKWIMKQPFQYVIRSL